jgi:hypothetical protein
MRVGFGKTNPLHLHVLPWPDEPLPVVNLLGGDEGWVGTGVSVARLIPMPAEIFSELTVQVLSGDSDGLFSAPSRGDLAYAGRYRLFRDLSEATNLDVGLSYGLVERNNRACRHNARGDRRDAALSRCGRPRPLGRLPGRADAVDPQQPGGEQRPGMVPRGVRAHTTLVRGRPRGRERATDIPGGPRARRAHHVLAEWVLPAADRGAAAHLCRGPADEVLLQSIRDRARAPF